MNEENFELRAKFYKKLNAFRADVIQCDWKDDKTVSLGGTKGYPYLSSDKIIKNLAPLLVKHGVELDVEYSDLTDYTKDGTRHWSVKATIFLTDVDTGYTTHSCAYGEGQDAQDKGIAKAQTAAFKKCLAARNMIADGIDPDAVDTWEPSNYYKKSAEEQEEVKSKVLANAVKPEVQTKAEVKPAEEKKTLPPFKNLDETAKTFPESNISPTINKFKPTIPQQKAIDRIKDRYEEMARGGQLTPDQYHEMVKDVTDIASPQDVVDFLNKYRSRI